MDMPCSRCEQTIPSGHTHWSINVHQEACEGDVIEVKDATCTHVFCEGCASKLDLERLTVPEKPAS